MTTKGKPYRVSVHYQSGTVLSEPHHSLKRALSAAWRHAELDNLSSIWGHRLDKVVRTVVTDTRTGVVIKTHVGKEV